MSDWKTFNDNITAEYRATGGAVTGQFAGVPLLLLTTTGAKSGKQFTTPLVYGSEGDQMFLIASKAGAPSHPDWYHNLVANPAVTIELGAETYEAKATVADPETRDRLYALQASQMANFAEYAKATTRTIPIVLINRLA